MKSSNNEFQERCSEYQAKVESLINDKIILMKAIEGLQKENHNLKRENDQLNSELLKCKAKLAHIEGELLHAAAVKSKETELLEKLKASESLIHSLKEEHSKSSSIFKEKISKLTNCSNQALQENKELLNKIHDIEYSLNKKDQELQLSEQENNRLITDIACMEQHLCVKEDTNQIVDNLINSVKDLRQETKEQEKTITEQKGKISHSIKIIEELENNLKEKSDEVEVLMSAVIKLQRNRENYIPVANDPVDTALADYINTLDDPLPVPFTREEEGTYLFGTKRIFVKLEQGTIIIRVGGGFMQVNEFIDVYTSAEVDKFGRQKAERAQKIRQSFMHKLTDVSGRDSPTKFSACFGVQRRSTTKSTLSPVNHTNSL